MQPILCPCERMNPGTDITIREDPFDFAFIANYTLWPDNKFVSWCFKIDRGYYSMKHIRNDTKSLEKYKSSDCTIQTIFSENMYNVDNAMDKSMSTCDYLG